MYVKVVYKVGGVMFYKVSMQVDYDIFLNSSEYLLGIIILKYISESEILLYVKFFLYVVVFRSNILNVQL